MGEQRFGDRLLGRMVSRRVAVALLGLATGWGLGCNSSDHVPHAGGQGGTLAGGGGSAQGSCDNGILDGHETDIDCGGGACAGCANGADCSVASDCLSHNCDGNICTPCTDEGMHCPADAYCDDENADVAEHICKSKLANGDPCDASTYDHEQCTSGQCIDGFCCDTPCTETCAACGVPGIEGTCAPYPSGADPEDECAADVPSCKQANCNGTMGAAACDASDGTECIAASCGGGVGITQGVCGSGSCSGSTMVNCAPYTCNTLACNTSCVTSAECTAGHFCNTSTSTCEPQLTQGSSCTGNIGADECTTGHCVDGVCCDGPCGETCASCALPGAEGTCTAYAGGSDPENECNEDIPNCVQMNCNGSIGMSACTASNGTECVAASCSGGVETTQGTCTSGVCGGSVTNNCSPSYVTSCAGSSCNTICISNSDCTAGNFCSALNECVGAAQLSAGFFHTCARLNDGTVRCWGFDGYGALGNGNNLGDTNTPQPVVGLADVSEVTSGTLGRHTCARHDSGIASCWGDNASGALGNNTTTNTQAPVPVSNLTNAAAVSAGGFHSCALRTDNTISCWGENADGQLGNGSNIDSLVPAPILNFGCTPAAISAGGLFTCARCADGGVRCWGNNFYGQLGNGQNTNSNNPVAVTGVTSAVAIASGGSHACALLLDGTVVCWGLQADGVGNDSNVPIPQNISNAVAISASQSNRNCALLTSGSNACWVTGGLPAGPTLNGVVGTTSGNNHTCVALSDGTVACWGTNQYGQLGDGTYTTSYTVPVAVMF